MVELLFVTQRSFLPRWNVGIEKLKAFSSAALMGWKNRYPLSGSTLSYQQ